MSMSISLGRSYTLLEYEWSDKDGYVLETFNCANLWLKSWLDYVKQPIKLVVFSQGRKLRTKNCLCAM